MDQTNNLKTNESKPPYLIGILGLIPLVGFFVGIFLIILGITKYKNKKLTLIGVACMIFTIIAYSSLYYIGFVSDFGKKGWEQHAQMQLNSLPKYIEFYKLENGKYPDSLKQLESKNEFIFLNDPTQKADKNNPNYYNYKNLGDKYLLFSSGSDQKPYTKDDIYPKVKMNNNIGWTKTE
jgi:hypothetical protein